MVKQNKKTYAICFLNCKLGTIQVVTIPRFSGRSLNRLQAGHSSVSQEVRPAHGDESDKNYVDHAQDHPGGRNISIVSGRFISNLFPIPT